MAKKAGAFWVRIDTDIWYNNDAVTIIDQMPDGDSILLTFFKLLTHAGKSNADGQLLMNGFIPMSPDMLAGVVKRPQEQIDRAIEVLAKFGLIHLDNDAVEIANFDEFVNVDVMAQIREKQAERTRKSRERARKKNEQEDDVTLQSRYSDVTVPVTCNGHIRTRELENLEKKELKEYVAPDEPEQPGPQVSKPEPEADPIPYKEIIDHLNAMTGQSFKYAEGHKKHIRARWKEGHRLEDFKRVIDSKTEEWLNAPKNRDGIYPRTWLRPETLFGPKFDGYRQVCKTNVKGAGANGEQGNQGGEGLGSFVIG